MAFIRRVRTASGATAVQIAEYSGGRQRIVKHVGSAHTEAELGMLLKQAGGLLADPAQGELDLGVEPTPRVRPLVAAVGDGGLLEVAPGSSATPAEKRDGPGRVVGTDSRLLFEALASVFTAVGFDALDDAVFRDLVIARVVEPTSLLVAGRVLRDLGRVPASYATMKRGCGGTSAGRVGRSWTSIASTTGIMFLAEGRGQCPCVSHRHEGLRHFQSDLLGPPGRHAPRSNLYRRLGSGRRRARRSRLVAYKD